MKRLLQEKIDRLLERRRWARLTARPTRHHSSEELEPWQRNVVLRPIEPGLVIVRRRPS